MPKTQRLRIFVLGGGTPTPTPTRFGSAYVVKVGDEHIMFDCGPAATDKLVKAGLRPTQVDHLFFTHHHFDHDIDYPCFLLCRWDQGAGRENRLSVFGPTPTELITDRILDADRGAFAHDWKARINAPVSQRVYVNRGGVLPRQPPVVDVSDVGPGLVHRTSSWEVTAARAEHVQPWLDSLAYRLDSVEGSVVITGDTEPCASVVDLARGADAMLCMCWDDREGMETAGEARGQCSIEDAADMAQAAGVRRLVLVHLGPRISTDERLARGLRAVAARFGGQVVVSRELASIDL